MPTQTPSSSKTSIKPVTSSIGICVNSMFVNEAFCVTGSDDGFLRLWNLDFKQIFLEAEHEGSPSCFQMFITI